MLQTGDIVFDCGGHHGKTAVFFSKLVDPSGSVVAFEPRPQNVKVIEQNLEINDVKNVSVEQKALGDKPSKLRLRNRSNGSMTWKRWQQGIEVDVITLDDYAKDHSLWPTFIKIDVEGFEGQVLRGATEILSRAPKLAIEIHIQAVQRYGDSIESLLELLKTDRYNCWILEEQGDISEFTRIPKGQDRVHLFAIPK